MSETPVFYDGKVREGLRGSALEPWHRLDGERRGLLIARCGRSFEPDRVEVGKVMSEPACPVCWRRNPDAA